MLKILKICFEVESKQNLIFDFALVSPMSHLRELSSEIRSDIAKLCKRERV